MKPKGFSLLELLITLSILGILFAFAIPNYSEYWVHTQRLAAETTLMKLAGHMEAFFAEHGTYEGSNLNLFKIPEYIANNSYQLMIRSATKSEFKLAAIPQNKQALYDDRCGMLLLDSKGEKQVSGYSSLNDCW